MSLYYKKIWPPPPPPCQESRGRGGGGAEAELFPIRPETFGFVRNLDLFEV